MIKLNAKPKIKIHTSRTNMRDNLKLGIKYESERTIHKEKMINWTSSN